MPHAVIVNSALKDLAWLADNIEDAAGHWYVAEYSNGQDALTACQAQLPDAIICNVLLEGCDGFSLIRQVKMLPGGHSVVAILLSDFELTDAARDLAKNIAVQGIMPKPWNIDILSSLLHINDDIDLEPVHPAFVDDIQFMAQHGQICIGLLLEQNTHLQRALESNKELEHFAFMASHDLRSPLRNIHLYASMLLEDYRPDLPPEGQEYISLINQKAESMSELIQELLEFSRLNSKNLRYSHIHLEELIYGVVDELSEGHTDIVVSIEPIPNCYGDRILLKQVFQNLISNAVKFMCGAAGQQTQRCIRIYVHEQTQQFISYGVEDTGCGISEGQLESVFEPFNRAGKGHSVPGHGLGLSIVQRIINRHNGNVSVHNNAKGGATFVVALPKH